MGIEETYQGENCGKTVKISDEKIPECCGKPMEKLPLDIRLSPLMQSTPDQWRVKTPVMISAQENKM